MSSPDPLMLRRIALVAPLCLALAGCFRPVYGESPAAGVTAKGVGVEVAELMRSIEVKPAETRVELKMRNELIFLLRGGGAAAPKRYTLKYTLRSYGQSAVVDPLTNATDTRTITMHADYELIPAGAIDPIAKGHAAATATFFTSLQRFANVRAERDAEDRAATQLAERIRSRLQAFFAAGT